MSMGKYLRWVTASPSVIRDPAWLMEVSSLFSPHLDSAPVGLSYHPVRTTTASYWRVAQKLCASTGRCWECPITG